jgi:hypothetical protein
MPDETDRWLSARADDTAMTGQTSMPDIEYLYGMCHEGGEVVEEDLP